MTGHFAKANVPPVRMIKEVADRDRDGRRRGRGREGRRPRPGRHLRERAVCRRDRHSKGRGFAGVVRRHGFGGGPKSHGHMFQVQGSIGASSFPSRVFPGPAHAGPHGHGPDDGAQPAHPRRSISKTICCWSRARSRASRCVCADLEGEGAAAGASWIRRCGDEGRAEGFEEGCTGEEEVSDFAAVSSAARRYRRADKQAKAGGIDRRREERRRWQRST